MKQTTFRMAAMGALVSALSLTMANAEEKWVEDWKAYAAQTGEQKHAEWVKLISDPEAVKLAKEWAELRGYTASSLVAKADLPADLKPGLVINKDNISQYPWLKDYMPKAIMDRLQSGDWFQWKEIVIVPTNSYYMQRGVMEETREAVKEGRTFTATPEGNLLTGEGKHALATQGALPFIHPKNGLELNWQFVAHGVSIDNLAFKPVKFDVCDSSNNLEREYEGALWWQKFHGRKDYPPYGSVPNTENIVEGGGMYFLKPFDVRGLAAVRLRYAEADRDDDFRVFIPGLRRTRVLAGSDGQDPMAAGLEITWDEWRGYWLKTDPKSFEYNLVGEGFILAQPETGHVYDPATRSENGCQMDRVELELRPVWILEIDDKEGNYQYSKRRIYIDKENYYLQHEEMYDRRGNLWRVWDDVRDFDPKTGQAMWKTVVEWNPISNRLTHLDMTSSWGTVDEEPSSAIFDIDHLRDYR
ncbi:outer membrane lipoprotein-sorting protein [Emcibacter nanhaiensis]|uniref:Outer membrane lipoprotein-sorting protein n=1 Tax=Emcibacter nanhaiensis TaxID=1505037 RepID=A0A501PKK0_9PROT|nr:outer membrane lipoprotein-sorting protein [Emcibacter nanhaiensis]TPD60627.1 outer membrane lipoprotein-sorting protein [Emcibacter nanhaiensis]